MLRNDNLDANFGKFKPRLRFDRVFVRKTSPVRVEIAQFGLIGIERLKPYVCFPSDHWGMITSYQICWKLDCVVLCKLFSMSLYINIKWGPKRLFLKDYKFGFFSSIFVGLLVFTITSYSNVFGYRKWIASVNDLYCKDRVTKSSNYRIWMKQKIHFGTKLLYK